MGSDSKSKSAAAPERVLGVGAAGDINNPERVPTPEEQKTAEAEAAAKAAEEAEAAAKKAAKEASSD